MYVNALLFIWFSFFTFVKSNHAMFLKLLPGLKIRWEETTIITQSLNQRWVWIDQLVLSFANPYSASKRPIRDANYLREETVYHMNRK